MLVNEYAKCFVTPDVRYINREEDVGDEGMRRSKESYHPVRLLEKISGTHSGTAGERRNDHAGSL